ncbi:MAG: thiolase family protein [Candidatus Alcyoniella australis]|nr:thiolase family protein [Candidatus Alcyoniella australis]
MREVVIVAACRTAVGKAKRGSLVDTRPDDMAATVIAEVVKRAGIKPEIIDDVVFGCAMPEAEQGMNVARNAVFLAGLPQTVPAMTLNRYCSSGMQAIWNVATDIMAGTIDVGIGGGTETMSMIPMGGNKIVPNIKLGKDWPGAYSGMGQTAENVAMKYGVSREDQDQFGLESNRKAAKANETGAFKEQIVPLNTYMFDGKGNKKEFVFEVDEGPRGDANIETMAKLRPAFANPKAKTPEKLFDGSEPKGKLGTVTAANSSQMSDGAAAVLLMAREKAEELGLTPMARVHGVVTVAFEPELMGIGPALAVPRLMEKVGKPLGIGMDDIGVFELNEAFASQGVYCSRELGLVDDPRVNPNGGAIALGHPLGCTGAKLTTQIVYHMKDNNLKYGVVTMCIGGGMGAAGLYENLLYEEK